MATLTEMYNDALNSVENIKGETQRTVTKQVLENWWKVKNSESQVLAENTNTQNIAGFDPILIRMIRRATPRLIAYEICGVQPMSMPSGLVYALRSRYNDKDGDEALFNKIDSAHSGKGTDSQYADATENPFEAAKPASTGEGKPTVEGETEDWKAMSFTIESVDVKAKTRQLKAEYTIESDQDLRAIHGLDMQTELGNILSNELVVEQNREIVNTIYRIAKVGAQWATTAGKYDMLQDSDGRYNAERFRGLAFALEREANAIAVETRRGKGNIIICSADVASALQMAGRMDFAPAMDNLTGNLNVDITGATFAGMMGKIKVFIDPFVQHNGFVVGYKGNVSGDGMSKEWDAGLFFCPYIMAQQYTAVKPDKFGQVLGFKSRYGLVANPFTTMNVNENIYYRKVAVTGF